MKPRDLAVVAAILLVVAFAGADALRHRSPSPPRRTGEMSTGSAETAPTSAAGVPVPPLPAAGTLALTRANDCVIHEFVTGSGDEFPHPRLATDCRLSAAPVSGRIAYGVGGFGSTARFRFVDLVDVSFRLPVERGRFDSIIWSPDGQRAAWCRGTRAAFEVQLLGGHGRRLGHCPALYLPTGRLAYVRGRSLVGAGGTVFTARRPIEFAAWPSAGRLFLVLRGGLAVSPPGALVRVPGWVPGERPVVSPDGCAGLFARGTEVDTVDACRPGRNPSYPGTAAAWSPNGKWVAVANGAHIDFYDLRHSVVEPAARWDRSAAALVWR
jgi:WD40-like Beta Propeller Repeat